MQIQTNTDSNNEGREYLASAPWASVLPGLAVSLTVLGATLLGDALGGHEM